MKIKTSELNKKSPKDLSKMISDSREKLRELRFGVASGKIKNIAEIKETRRLIARILTILKKK